MSSSVVSDSPASSTPHRLHPRDAQIGQMSMFWQSTSPAMQGLLAQIPRVAATDVPMLAVGESGTGKELVARAVHERSNRQGKPFIAVNCGAIPATLIESELFGHEKGGFTGAVQQKAGYFEQAHGGTLFLDEVTEMALDMQIKLLRVLETRTFHRVGGDTQVVCDVRIVSATNRDPMEAVRSGQLREDLLYRLAVFPLHIPPLRDRREDIVPMAKHFLAELNAAEGTDKVFSNSALERMCQYGWPGNVRELKNTIHRAFILADRVIEVPNPNIASQPPVPIAADGILNVRIGTSLADAQRGLILATLARFDGDKRRAAHALGISLKTLYNRLDTYRDG
ncbi:sigma-54-dependent Fis family transcriptional regulator [Cupriavidus respiraculi]|uniref:Regulatory protein LuxO n=1 Tax=Cupriavidus respiraculi TaxID=195930 RepID=A0ABN7Z5L6_9BURK|nr:sigma-54 dependent transcriptional regulator [Cupriavidus respiraculi]MBY4948393.1 sigma-54 dependent transcriptional regulator [Cupriavidus respiraculi]CAG9180021.1 Regulatory protein LuxO [Cupriavidus respiraculi]